MVTLRYMDNILYIHGMGGGGDSRIPSILKDCFRLNSVPASIIVRTYDFDPEVAAVQIANWMKEVRPVLVIGESLGALHALRIKGLPHLFVSPALNTPFYFEAIAWLTLIPGVTWLFDRIYRPRDGDRQSLHFKFSVLRKYLPHRRAALRASLPVDSEGVFHAFFGTADHYRRSGIVSVRSWKKHFGNSFQMYIGTHYMEEEYVKGVLFDKILDVLKINK